MAKAETGNKKPNVFKRIVGYFKDLRSETKKVVWPTKETTLRATMVVLVTIVIVGGLVVLMDLAFNGLLSLFLKIGG